MEWRCEWCGKPHEEDDPPCDNCGHGTFEKAVVQQAGDEQGQDSTVVWVCTDCGREHTKNSPPCSRCNNATLERQKKVITEENLTDGPETDTIESVEMDTMTVWVCSNCGNEHTKNTPPCDSCGTATFERETKTIDDGELTTPGYVDLLTPRYAAVLGVVLLIAVAFLMGAVGIVDIPFFPDTGVPDVEDVPGNETTTANGLSLREIELEYVETVNTQRDANGLAVLERNGQLDDIARFDNQQRVRATFEDATIDEETVRELLTEECTVAFEPDQRKIGVSEDDTAASLGSQFAFRLGTGSVETQAASLDSIGVHVHAVDGDVYLTEILCES